MPRSRAAVGDLFVKGYWSVAGSLALALVDDRQKAAWITRRAFAKSFARLSHLRDAHEFEISLLGHVIRVARRVGKTSEVDLNAAFFLEHVLEFPTPAIAEILDRTEHRARQLHTDVGSRPLVAPRLEPPSASIASRVAKRVWVAPVVVGCLVLGSIGAAFWIPSDPRQVRQTNETLQTAPPLPELLNPHFIPTEEPVIAASGFAGGRRWLLRVYPAEPDAVCMELRVDEEFGDVHCLNTYENTIHPFVAADRRRGVTFVFGYASAAVKGLTIAERRSAPLNIELDDAPGGLQPRGPAQVFLVSLPDYLLQLVDRRQGRNLGYRIHTLVLEATDDEGARVNRTILHLGRPG